MKSQQIGIILIIDGSDDFLWSDISPIFDGLMGICERCGHLYEAISILSGTPEGTPVTIAGMANEFMKETGSFFTFLNKYPNLFCIALDPVGRDYPYPLRQAIWHGQFLICRSKEDLLHALLWTVENSCQRAILSSQTKGPKPLERSEYQLSQEEMDALFNPLSADDEV